MEPWELAAREHLRDLVARYAHAADTGRFDEVAALFADDGVLRIDDREPLTGRDAIRGLLAGARTNLRAATEQPYVHHHVSSLRLTLDDPLHASGACYFFVVTERGSDHWGRYRDRYVCREGRWLFAERRVRVDGWAPGSWAGEGRGRPSGPPDARSAPSDLSGEVAGSPAHDAPAALRTARAAFEARYIAEVMHREGGNVPRAAEVLGLSRMQLHRKLKEYGVRRALSQEGSPPARTRKESERRYAGSTRRPRCRR